MKRMNLALLSEEVVTDTVEQDEINLDELTARNDQRAENHEAGDVIEDAQADLEVLDAAQEALAGDQLSAASLKAFAMVMGRINQRSGYCTASQSLEAVGSTQQALLNDAKQLRKKLGTDLNVAEEGLIEDFMDSLAETNADSESIEKALTQSLDKIKSSGSIEIASTIDGGRWTTKLAPKGELLTFKDAAATVDQLAKILDEQHLSQDLKEISEYIAQVTKEIRDSWFIAGAENVKRIKEIRAKLEIMEQNAKRTEAAATDRTNSDSKDAEPLTEAQAAQLVAKCQKLMMNNAYDENLAGIGNGRLKYAFFAFLNAKIRLGGLLTGGNTVIGTLTAGDLRNGYMAMVAVKRIYDLLEIMVEHRNSVMLAAATYVKKSTK